MSLLPHDTFVNASRQLYADQGSGGGSTSSLQSPASIVPDGLGNISLSMTALGDSLLTVRAQGPVSGAGVNIVSDNGIANLNINGNTAAGAFLNMEGLDAGPFIVMNASGTTPYPFTMRAAPARVGQGPFFDYNPTAGTLGLGDGQIGGTITMNSPVSITSATIGQASYQQVIGTVVAATPITITNPTANGLYSVMMTTSALDIDSQQACIGVVAYWRNGVGWTAGGNVSTPLNALGNQYAQLLTGGGNGAMQFQTSTGVPTLNGMGCSVVQLTGTIPAF